MLDRMRKRIDYLYREHGEKIIAALDGRVWVASVEVKGDGVATKKRAVRSVSATASSPIGAIRSLIAKLDGAPRETADFEGGWS
jgi:hypothetical protein